MNRKVNRLKRPLIALCVFLGLAGPAFSQNAAASTEVRDFMFLYPTVFGPAIEFRDKTYGTGFGIDAVLVKELKGEESLTFLLNSYESKVFWGNVIFYPGLILSADVGLGLPIVGVANMISGSAYEDLSRSVSFYNQPAADKIVFTVGQFGYKLRWNNQDYDPHDPKILGVLDASDDTKPFIDGYRSKTNTALVVASTSFLYPIAGVLIGLRMGPLGLLVLGLGGAGAGGASFLVSSFVGSAAEADLVQGVRIYNKSH